MDREPTDLELKLDDILDEFAPVAPPAGDGGEDPKGDAAPAEKPVLEEKSVPEEKPAPDVQKERPPQAVRRTRRAAGRTPPASPPPDGEVEEPTLRLVAKDGKLVGRPPETVDLSARTRRMELPEETEEFQKKKAFWRKRKPQADSGKNEQVIPFPDEGQATSRVGRLIQRGDQYAASMFQGDEEVDPEEAARERLLPGVDYEEEPTHAPRPRRMARRLHRPKPDLPPAELAKRCKRGLAFLHTRVFLALILAAVQVYLTLAPSAGLPMVPALAGDPALRGQVAAIALGVSGLLAADVLFRGVVGVVTLQMEGDTLLLFAIAASIADALTMPVLGDRGGVMPYCGVVSVAVVAALWSKYLKLRGLRQSCRVAASTSEPYEVTQEERAWNGQDAYVKVSGDGAGYGSQIQEPDGAQRAYHIAAPLILLAAGLFSLLASVGMGRPELLPWCLSATLTAGCGLTCFLPYALPYSSVALRLSRVGAALGGWDSLRWGGKGRGVVLTDTDLFPPGNVKPNGIRLCGEMSVEGAVSYAASLIRETGSGMEKPFRDWMRAEGGMLRRCDKVMCHEGGVSGVIKGRQVYVGSAAFMELMHVPMERGVKVKNGVFCAVDGRLEAMFALSYCIHPAVTPTLGSLIANGVNPILATRDFLVIPDMLRRQFKLPVNRMEFPNLDRRRELSGPRERRAPGLWAVLCREGLIPYAEAVVAGRRLASATRLGVFFSLLGSVAGLLLAFYLTAVQAVASLTPGTLLVFLLLWLVPAALVAGWATRY